MEKEELDNFVAERMRQREAETQMEYARAKAEAEIKEQALIVQDPTKALQTKLNMKVAEHIDNSEVVAQKIEQAADKLVDKGLKAQENKATANELLSEDEILDADYEKNKNEYLYHGINHKIDKKWKRTIIHVINDIWFVIWAIVSCFTIVPVSTFLSRVGALKGFIKGVAIILGIVMLLACLGGITYAILRQVGLL